MLLGGLWHGAAWTFVVWGALHGAYLCINHAWNNFGPKAPPRFARAANLAGLILTFLAVVVAWVFFRADNMTSALNVLSKMADPGNVAFGRARNRASPVRPRSMPRSRGSRPNTQEIMGYDHEQQEGRRGAQRLEDAPAVHLCKCGGAGVRDSRNPAAQRIHLFQVLMRNPAKYLPRFLCAAALMLAAAVALNLCGRSAAAVPAGAAVCGDVFAGSAACRTPD